MFACDCWFFRTHQEGVTAKELAGITERAKQLSVTPISDSVVRLFLVRGGEAEHYVTKYPDGDESRFGNCKHIIAVRNSLEAKDEQERTIQATMGFEVCGEVEPPEVSCDVSAVG